MKTYPYHFNFIHTLADLEKFDIPEQVDAVFSDIEIDAILEYIGCSEQRDYQTLFVIVSDADYLIVWGSKHIAPRQDSPLTRLYWSKGYDKENY